MTQAYHQSQFLLSVARLTQLPADQGMEVAFAGRSNAGKSSALNALTQQKQLARVSKTPGRTQMINLFTLDEQRRLVDLPGYGYAKVPLPMKLNWQKTLATYLETRDCLQGLVLLMDIRHPLKDSDLSMINWAVEARLPLHILLTKADKLKKGPANNALQAVSKQLQAEYFDKSILSVQLFSVKDRERLKILGAKLNEWFNL